MGGQCLLLLNSLIMMTSLHKFRCSRSDVDEIKIFDQDNQAANIKIKEPLLCDLVFYQKF